MSTTARQPKATRKGPDPAARRTPAWGNPRASPTPFSPGNANARLPNGNQQGPPSAFPPLANGARPPSAPADPNHARYLSQISGLTGTTITVSTKTNLRFEGVVVSTSAEGDTNGITLKDVKEVSTLGAPLRETFFIAVTNIQEWASGPADAKVPNGADSSAFKTDTDISHKASARRERELQAWQPDLALASADPTAPSAALGATNGRNVDEVTFGPNATGGSWDQFAVNEIKFGVKASFDEDVYTTKLDRNAPNFKERERKAQQVANEIMSSTTSNIHVAEERVMNLTNDGSTANEEDKYGAVVRGANAYIPPGARKQGAGNATPPVKAEIPKVAVNAPDGSAVPASTAASTPPASKSSTPPNSTVAAKPADAVPAFRNFVSTEKDRLLKKKQALMKSEMDKRLSDFVTFSKTFKLNKPIPDDLVPILAKDEDKRRQIVEKSTRDAEDTHARSIGVSSMLNVAPGARPTGTKGGPDTGRAAVAVKLSGDSGSAMQKTATAPSKPGDAAPKKISMVIQSIPPFKSKRPTSSTAVSVAQPQPTVPSVTNGAAKAAANPLSPTAQNRLNVNASSFRPNVKASAFSPAGSPNSNGAAPSSSSTNGKQSENALPQGPPNPFFGTRVFKKAPPVHVKDDFNPFKHHKVNEAAQVSPQWPYNGKRYIQMFPPIQVQPQQQSPPMAPPGPPPPTMPQATYEEDPAARGFVYAYPPYGYPGQMVQPMMPGMGPPPGSYMPGPYMQPMPYPMPPPGVYPSTPMGQMPPPQYMPPPPPGPYAPPPSGAGNHRPSMPPTPIPSHAHPYYHHQSPQLQHAVPYPMMMPPPGPPHPYDPNAQPPQPPVQMGGVNHA